MIMIHVYLQLETSVEHLIHLKRKKSSLLRYSYFFLLENIIDASL